MKKTFILVIIVVVVVGTGAFWGGMVYGKSHAAGNLSASAFGNMTGQQRQQFFAGNGGQTANGGRMRGNGGFSNGQIIAKDDKSITLKMPDGSTKIIFYSTSTITEKTVNTTAADLSVGQNVATTGTANSDGSITAQTISIRPSLPDGQNIQNPTSGAGN